MLRHARKKHQHHGEYRESYLEVVAGGVVSAPEEGCRRNAFIIRSLGDRLFLEHSTGGRQVRVRAEVTLSAGTETGNETIAH